MNMFLSFVFGEQYTNQLRDNVSIKFAVTKLLIQESKKLISYC